VDNDLDVFVCLGEGGVDGKSQIFGTVVSWN
jgi:hypothetical protein